MPRRPQPSNTDRFTTADRLRPLLCRWLGTGSLLLLCLPALRGSSPWIGWLPYWLVLAPLMCLVVLEWRRLATLVRRQPHALQRRIGRIGHRQARRQPLRPTRPRLNLAALVAGRLPPAV